jgi:hypothetical protein
MELFANLALFCDKRYQISYSNIMLKKQGLLGLVEEIWCRIVREVYGWSVSRLTRYDKACRGFTQSHFL